jgi:hypothetical protein
MATILAETRSLDGARDVDVTLSNGQRHTFHFVIRPVNLQSAVDQAETTFLAAQIVPVVRVADDANRAVAQLESTWKTLTKSQRAALKARLTALTTAVIVEAG